MYDRDGSFMRTILLGAILLCAAALAPSAFAGNTAHPPLPGKIMEASTVYVDCVCPRGLAVARATAVRQLRDWGRFEIADNHRQADLVLLFSGNPYLGDYLTRDGPDTRLVTIQSTIMTVIDPNTGRSLWTDSRQSGSWRVSGATKDLIEELRVQMEGQTKNWTLNDVLMCGVTPVYAGFAQLTPDEALAKPDSGTGKVYGTPDRLMLTSPEAPEFCKRAQFVFSADHRIVGFEVNASQGDALDVGEVLERGDQFNFTGGKYVGGDQVYFLAQSKDTKIVIQFNVEGRRTVLSRVSYSY
jgi:hypothetical protein